MSKHEERTEIREGSLWRARPPGREVVEVRRIWVDTRDGVTVLRAHPVHGGKPLVTSVQYLSENYDLEGASDE